MERSSKVADGQFDGSIRTLELLLKQSARHSHVVARAFSQGSWYQYSGRDFVSHMGRASSLWVQELPPVDSLREGSLLWLTKPSYGSWVSYMGALLSGYHVMFLPAQAGLEDVKWCAQYFKAIAIVTDMEPYAKELSTLDLPVFNVESMQWVPGDPHGEPECLKRLKALQKKELLESPLKKGEHTSSEPAGESESWEGSIPAAHGVGKMHFVSFGHDGFQKPESLHLDQLYVVAIHFLQQANVPPSIFWKSMELLPLSNPFGHLSKVIGLLKNGVLGFLNEQADFETNWQILRPSYLFVSPREMQKLTDYLKIQISNLQKLAPRKLEKVLSQAGLTLGSTKALKLSEGVFDLASRSLRALQRWSLGKETLDEILGDLRFVVHGLAPASSTAQSTLQQLGVPLMESYGVTAAGGMLSVNSYDAPHGGLVGYPLAHVSFRLGAQSMLEYRINHKLFQPAGKWIETGDIAQMTPFGFSITGRKRHLFLTTGGTLVSPVQMEHAFVKFGFIKEICIIGAQRPYLVALVDVDPEFKHQHTPEEIQYALESAMNEVNSGLARNVTVKKWKMVDKPFLDSDGERLPNGLLNRFRILETRKTEIENLYL